MATEWERGDADTDTLGTLASEYVARSAVESDRAISFSLSASMS